MRTNILFYYFALYVVKNVTIIETTQPAFIEWLKDCGEESLIGDHQPIFRHFQKLLILGYVERTGRKTEDGFNIYRINRPENFEDRGMMSDSDMLLRVFFASMLENMDYQQMPAAERSLLSRSITEPRGSIDGERIKQMTEFVRWSEHPATELMARNLGHLEVLSEATKAVGRYGQQAVNLCEIHLLTARGEHQTWQVHPIEVQVRGDQVLLYSVTKDLSSVVWIPLRFVENVNIVADETLLNTNCETYFNSLSFTQLLQPDVLKPYLFDDLINGYNVLLRFDAQGWEQLHSGHLPADADIESSELQVELLHPLTFSLVRWIMQFGRHIHIVEPLELRNMVRNEVIQMLGEAG